MNHAMFFPLFEIENDCDSMTSLDYLHEKAVIYSLKKE